MPKVDYETTRGLIKALRSPAANVRGTAAVNLKAKGSAVFNEVKQLLADDNRYIQARALWILPYLGDKGVAVVTRYLQDEDPQRRITAYRALRRVNAHRPHAANLAKDPSAAVRREVALSMRDVPFAKSKNILKTIAKRYEGNDRWYLEALGTGATGHEEKLFKALNKTMGTEALDWSEPFTDIAWRLHPPAALQSFAQRAKAKNLPIKDRIRMLTAIAFNPAENSVDVMLAISEMPDRGNDKEVIEMAKWWTRHPHFDDWQTHDALKGFFEPDEITQDYLVPTHFGVATKLPDAKAILALEGHADNGAVLIARCIVCHEVNKTLGGIAFGPNISGFGKTQTREVLLKTIIAPSDDIAHGFEGYEITMKNGKKVQGIKMGETTSTIHIKVFGGQTLTVARKDIPWDGEKKMKQSLMVSGANMGLTAQEIRDLVEYLKTASGK